MPSFLSRVKTGATQLDVRHGHGLVSHAVETGEYLGFSYLAARANTQFGEKAKWRGMELTYVGGIVGKLAAVAADIFGYGDGWAHHVNTASNALLGTHFASIGARHGIEAAAKGAVAPARPAAITGDEVFGAIPAAPEPGRFLDLAEIERLAAMHG